MILVHAYCVKFVFCTAEYIYLDRFPMLLLRTVVGESRRRAASGSGRTDFDMSMNACQKFVEHT